MIAYNASLSLDVVMVIVKLPYSMFYNQTKNKNQEIEENEKELIIFLKTMHQSVVQI